LKAPWRSFAVHPPRVKREELGASILCSAALALRQGSPNGCWLDVVQDGVIICRHRFEGPENLWAVVSANDWATDLSGFKVVEDSALEGRISVLRVECIQQMMPRLAGEKP
jgi:hypothetical protein